MREIGKIMIVNVTKKGLYGPFNQEGRKSFLYIIAVTIEPVDK